MDLQRIECPHCPVKKIVEFKEVVNHLQNEHQCFCGSCIAGEISIWMAWPLRLRFSTTVIAEFDNQTFLLMSFLREAMLFCWVTVLGSREDADRYEVKMTMTPQQKGDTTIS